MNSQSNATSTSHQRQAEAGDASAKLASDADDRQSLARSLPRELRELLEAAIGHTEMLREDARDRPPQTRHDLDHLLEEAKNLYEYTKQNLQADWLELEMPEFHERFRLVRHDIGNRLNHVLGYCQLLLADEQDHFFGTFTKDLECIRGFCEECVTVLSRYQSDDDVRRQSRTMIEPSVVDVAQESLPPRDEPFVPAAVLVVDDSSVTRDLMAKFLEREGHRVTTAADGQQALDLLEQADFDLILLDCIMPVMSGFRVLRRLKCDERLRHIPVIMISGLDSVADIVPCIEMGADDFLSKPVNFSLLKARANSSLERMRLREREFGQFFTPELARHYVRHPALLKVGREADVTVMFCDIRGFSRISERLGPADTVSWLSHVMSVLSDCVIQHDGVLVDYIGDELMAMWGAPQPQADHAELACRSAMDMLDRLPAINQRWQDIVEEPTDVTIGLNSGIAQVGNTGSDRKFKYGPLGNTVNLASRVRGATKYLATRMLVTGSTRQQLSDQFAARRLSKVQVVNIGEPVDLYEILPPDQRQRIGRIQQYEEALDSFEQRDLRHATSVLGQLLADHPDDGPAQLLISRVVEAQLHQTDEFNPVWELPGK